MKPKTFENIISFLIKKHRILPLEDFLSDTTNFQASEGKTATILFDDGFKDNIEFAAPILQKYNCTASFYIVTNCIDTGLPTWTYLVDYILQNAGDTQVEFPFEFAPEELKRIRLGKIPQEMNVIKKIKPWLKTLPDLKRNEAIQCMLGQCKEVELPKNKMMSWTDIRQLKQAGFIIGSHTHTHPLLTDLTEHEIDYELRNSAERIKNEIGIHPQTISYPNGNYDERVMSLAQENGYKQGLAVEQVFFKYDAKKLMCIPRVQLYEEPWWKIKLRMNGVHHTIKQLWS